MGGRHCPQPQARPGTQKAIEALPSPTQSSLLMPVAPRPLLQPKEASVVPSPGAKCRTRPHAVWQGYAAICPRRRQHQHCLPGPSPTREGCSHLVTLPPAFCCLLTSAFCRLHLSHWWRERLNPILTRVATAQGQRESHGLALHQQSTSLWPWEACSSGQGWPLMWAPQVPMGYRSY